MIGAVKLTLAALVLMSACTEDPTLGETPLEVDSGQPIPDASDPDPQPLVDGSYALEWTCMDGCPPLTFPLENYTELVVGDGQARFYTPGAQGEKAVAVSDGPSGCVNVAAIVYSIGSATEFSFCPAVGGPDAVVHYNATSGPAVERTYAVKATRTE